MFKAIGRLGSHVRSLHIPLISNLFTKSRPYGGLEDDETENFVDAKEELHSDTESESDGATPERTDVAVASVETVTDIQTSDETKEDCSIVLNDESSLPNSDDSNEIAEDKTVDSSRLEDTGESDTDEEDEHSHKDTKSIVKSAQTNSELGRSPSTSTFKRVHRRINSYSQRQYAKFDGVDSDSQHENDITTTPVANGDTDSSNTAADTVADVKNGKKPKRRKKVAKRARRAVRGSWKWFRRGMMQYAQSFNTAFFVVNVVGAAARKTY